LFCNLTSGCIDRIIPDSLPPLDFEELGEEFNLIEYLRLVTHCTMVLNEEIEHTQSRFAGISIITPKSSNEAG
jgi:hypothetical protein